MFGTIDSWLIYGLSNEKNHLTDPSNASWTFLMNLHSLKWDPKILNFFGFTNDLFLPRILSTTDYFGTVNINNSY